MLDTLPVKVSGLVVITPTAGSEVITDTSTVIPARSAWVLENVKFSGLSLADLMLTLVFPDDAVVVMLVGEYMTNPDGSTVMFLTLVE